jgi:predicted ATPase
MTIRRYVLTGAPGAGKTTLAAALRDRGHHVVPEAATDVIARRHAAGIREPWHTSPFAAEILALQQARERAGDAEVQILDRSPLCTLALARWMGVPPPPVTGLLTYDRVFLVQPIGFMVPTAARRISYADSLRFAAVHEDVYREHGYDLTEVPAAPVAERVALIESYL